MSDKDSNFIRNVQSSRPGIKSTFYWKPLLTVYIWFQVVKAKANQGMQASVMDGNRVSDLSLSNNRARGFNYCVSLIHQEADPEESRHTTEVAFFSTFWPGFDSQPSVTNQV